MFAEEISFYKLIKKIGAGGMGEVYLAEDTRLTRKVALKILPDDVAQDRKRLSRFLQEARLAANLNHPNICVIYEVNDSAETPFIAMEYLEGVTLAQKIQNKDLDLDEVITYCVQIADALDEAHHQGIIHRDIKSANVIINRRGLVKILDFGLAKSVIENVSEEAVTQAKTEAGVLVGTVQYMSPEHAIGKSLDGRTDLWSVGILLYEMATGETPFKGQTQVGIFDEILHKQPIPPSELNDKISPELEKIISKLLEKDREFRYQTASDLRADLRRLQRNSEEIVRVERTETRDSAQNIIPQSTAFVEMQTGENDFPDTVNTKFLQVEKLEWKYVLGGIILVGILGLIGFRMYLSSFNPPDKVSSMQLVESERLTNLGNVKDAKVSADGRYLVYVQDEGELQSLWLKQLPVGNAVQIVSPANIIFQGIAISPDNSWVYYDIWDRKGVGEIFRVSALGGAPQKVIHDCMPNIEISPDGKKIAFIRSIDEDESINLIIAETETWKETVLSINGVDTGGINSFAWSPDGRSLAILGGKPNSEKRYVLTLSEINVENRVVSEIWQIPQDLNKYGGGIVWAHDKSGIFLTLGEEINSYQQIWFVGYPSGNATQVTKNFNNYGRLSLTADGKSLVSVSQDFNSNIWVFETANPAKLEKITQGKLEGVGLSWTPDGKIVYASAVSGTLDIWIMDSDGGNKKQLTSDSSVEAEPCVSFDGKQIFYVSNKNNRNWNVWTMNIDGSNKKQFLTEGTQGGVECSRGDNSITYVGFSNSEFGIWRMQIDGGEALPLPLVSNYRPVISPDGSKLAYTAWNPEKKQLEQAIAETDKNGTLLMESVIKYKLPKTAVGENGDNEPTVRWTIDGKNLSFINEEKGIENIWIRSLKNGELRKLTNFTENSIFLYAWNPDGKKIAVTRYSTSSDVVSVKAGK